MASVSSAILLATSSTFMTELPGAETSMISLFEDCTKASPRSFDRNFASGVSDWMSPVILMEDRSTQACTGSSITMKAVATPVRIEPRMSTKVRANP